MSLSHVADALELAGLTASALGGLYLAYDLLGGRHGPLRSITRGATYSLLFGLGYGLTLGLSFGVIAGLTLGTILAVEFRRAAIHAHHVHCPSFGRRIHWFALARGLSLGLASMPRFGVRFGLWFGLLGSLCLMVAYTFHLAPSDIYLMARRPELRLAIFVRTGAWGTAVGLAGALSAWLASMPGVTAMLGLGLGLLVVPVATTVAMLSPAIEWWADHLPERRLGVIGVGLALIGFFLLAIVPLCVLLGLPLP